MRTRTETTVSFHKPVRQRRTTSGTFARPPPLQARAAKQVLPMHDTPSPKTPWSFLRILLVLYNTVG